MAKRLIHTFDIECYVNYFLLNIWEPVSDTLYTWERYNDVHSGNSREELLELLYRNRMIGFNNHAYDDHIVAAYLSGFTNAEMRTMSAFLIEGDKLAPWRVKDAFDYEPLNIKTYDINPVLPLFPSLKIYAARLHYRKLQELPVHFAKTVDDDDREKLVNYCPNDCRATYVLVDHAREKLRLRKKMGAMYGLDLMSKGDAGIAEAVLKSEVSKRGVNVRNKAVADPNGYDYIKPACVSFKQPHLKQLLVDIHNHKFKLSPAGKFVLPPFLKQDIEINGVPYKMGVGGLHSKEKGRLIRRGKGEQLCEIDVRSFYPSMIINNGWAPQYMGKHFTEVYSTMYDERLRAKDAAKLATDPEEKERETVINESLKIVLNSSYGKMGSKYSALYGPDLLVHTTLTGQLLLFMLIERMEAAGISVVSANTDGVVTYYKDDQQETWQAIFDQWQIDTDLVLERTDYKLIANMNVNSYIAVPDEGKVKRKGLLGKADIAHNPSFEVVADAVENKLIHDIDVHQHIMSETDFTKYISLQKVGGGAVWELEEVGGSVRWYIGKRGCNITYLKNGKCVPLSDNAMLVNDLPDYFPKDVDHAWYIDRAETIIESMKEFKL